MDNEDISGVLNSSSTADPDEVKLLVPGETTAGEKPAAVVDQVADADDETDGEEATARVDEELSSASNDAEREQIRARRRQERQEAKQRQKQARAETQRQLQSLLSQNADLRRRLDAVENHTAGSQLAQLQAAEENAVTVIGKLKAALADATTKGDGATAAEATERLLQAQTYLTNVAQAKKNFEARANQPRQPQLDPAMMDHAREFMGKHKWFGGTQSQDPDSKVLAAVDNSLVGEGWDPTTKAYWTELETRAAKYLPHRFNQARAQGGGYNGPKPADDGSSTVAGSSGGSSSAGSQTVGYQVNAERVKAMKDAGIWDDPKRRADMIKRYQEIDRQSRN